MRELFIIAVTLVLSVAGLIDDNISFASLAIGLTWCKLDDIRQAIIARKGDTHD